MGLYMSRRPARFTEADLRKAAKVAGKEMAVEILPDGTIRLIHKDAVGAKEPGELDFENRPPMVF